MAAARALALVLFGIAASAQAGELILAPGASVTILDAADPGARIVMTAPAGTALDLTELLSLKPEESVRSIVTRFQASYAGHMVMNGDGSISLSSSAPQGKAPTPGLAGGVLIRNGEQWSLNPGPANAAAPPAASAAPATPQGPKATIFKPGVTREEAEGHIAQCRKYSEAAVNPMAPPADRVSIYNTAMYSCLRGFGYEIRSTSG